MKQGAMKSWHMALFFAALLVAFGGIARWSPISEYPLTESIALRIPQWGQGASRDSAKVAADSAVRAALQAVDTNIVLTETPKLSSQQHAIPAAPSNAPLVKATLKVEDGNGSVLEFPKGDTIMWAGFVTKLRAVGDSGAPLRVLHFGDSQIEGDRMTSLIRSYFQSRYGGMGPGLQPLSPFVPMGSVAHSAEGQWNRYVSFGRKDQRLGDGQYGVRGVAHSYQWNPGEPPIAVTYKARKWGDRRVRTYRLVALEHGPIVDSALVSLYAKDSLIAAYQLTPGPAGYLSHQFATPVNHIRWEFTGPSPVWYHASMDGVGGVAVDNMAMRGASGYTFSMMDQSHFGLALQNQNVGMVILQFGGNTVPYIKDAETATKYGKRIARQIRLFKRHLPGVAVLVIGPSDMAFKDGLEWESYEFVSEVRDAMRVAAHSEGAAFFDVLQMMGGEGSMAIWASMDKPLAAPDHIHFTPAGARLVGKVLVNAMDEHFKRYEE